jgi:putative ABC transport system ATP-binding protein
MGGLDVPDGGSIRVDGQDLGALSATALTELRLHRIGFVFQAYNLIPVLTAVENAEYVMLLPGVGKRERRERAMAVLSEVGLAGLHDRKPAELSGGQQQRVAVARALANDPAIILADEPTGNLDLSTGEEIISLLKMLSREKNVTIISATHDLKMLNVSDRVVWVSDGRVDKIENRDELSISLGKISG